MRVGSCLVLMAALVAGPRCVLAQSGPDSAVEKGRPIPIEERDRAVVEAALRRDLKQANPAQLGYIRGSIDSKEIITVCGSVRVKAAFGLSTADRAFVGLLFDRFMSDGKPQRWFAVTAIGDTIVERLCIASGALPEPEKKKPKTPSPVAKQTPPKKVEKPAPPVKQPGPVIIVIAPPAPSTAPICKGLVEVKCATLAGCGWIAEAVRSNGSTVKAHCRTRSTKN